MAGYRGDYDPAVFDPADPSSWPGWTGTDAVYEAGDWWYVDTPGTLADQGVNFDATDLDVGDRIYPIGFGRLMGQGTFGSGVFGGPLTSPWRLSQGATVRFRPWPAMTDAPWDRPAPPYAGCPLDDRLPGWRIVFEALYANDATARRFGQDTFGSGVFGSGQGRSWESWNDLTRPNYAYRIRHGNVDGAPIVETSQLDVEVVDISGAYWPMTIPTRWDRPGVGNLCRLSLLDPYGSAVPMFVGRIEEIVDDHDRPPRLLELTAFGLTIDTVTVVDRWSRPSETTAARVDALLAAVGWSWAPASIADDLTQTAHASAAEPLIEVSARRLLDTYALSAGDQVDFDRSGRPRLRRWPLTPDPADPVLYVSDCPVAGDGYLPSDEANVVADLAEVLNVATAARGDVDGVDGLATFVDSPSVARFGRRSQAQGFPLSGLTATDATLAALVRRAVDRFGRTVNRVEAIEVAIDRDLEWFDVLVGLDSGRAVRWERRALPDVVAIDAVVVGVEHRLTVDHWDATLYLSTITPTL